MSIELVGLAYDETITDAIWQKVPVRAAFDLVLEDEFRRKVDLRSLLYHKGQIDLLSEFEQFMRQGGGTEPMVGLLARRFQAGVEVFPSNTGEFAFDFKLIRQFASLAMADDFLEADTFLRALLRKTGFLKNGAAWSLVETRDYQGVSEALREVRMNDILEVGQSVDRKASQVIYENLVRNYIEFLSYARNNKLTPFFYNSESDFVRWGNLADRKEARSEAIVDLSMRSLRKKKETYQVRTISRKKMGGFEEKTKRKRELDSLLGGLKDLDSLIRLKSAESLGFFADEEVVPQLIDALEDDEPEVRQELARALSAAGSDAAKEALLNLVSHDEVFSVQLTAAYVLKRDGVKRLIPLLIDGIEQGKPHFATLLAHHPHFVKDTTAKKRLLTLVNHKNSSVRRDLAYLFGRLNSKEVLNHLVRLLEDEDELTASNALYSLWDSGYPQLGKHALVMTKRASERCQLAGEIVGSWSKKSPKK